MSVERVHGRRAAGRPQVSTQELGAEKVVGTICTVESLASISLRADW